MKKKKRKIKNWVNKISCGDCGNKVRKGDTKLTKEGKRVCNYCFEKDVLEI